MKIVLTDAQTVLDDIVNADVLNRFGEVESFAWTCHSGRGRQSNPPGTSLE